VVVHRSLTVLLVLTELTQAYEGQGSEMKIWVPRRSATKPT